MPNQQMFVFVQPAPFPGLESVGPLQEVAKGHSISVFAFAIKNELTLVTTSILTE